MKKPEKWLDIPGYEGRYQASNLGRIRSLDYPVCSKRICHYTGKTIEMNYTIRGRVLKVVVGTHGYCVVSLGRFDCSRVHILVARTFLREPNKGELVMHRNDVRTDNRVSNLKWGTAAQNSAQMVSRGRQCRGESHWNWKGGERVA